MLGFYRPLVNELRRLAEVGFTWKHPTTNQILKSKVFAPMLSTDAQARYPLQNIIAFNSCDPGCSWCEIIGVRVNVGHGSATVFKKPQPPPEAPPGTPPVHPILRTEARMILAAETATHAAPVDGVRGACILSLIPHFDCATGFVSEYQHSFALGVIKQLLLHFKDPGFRDETYYIGNNLEVINVKIDNILTPNIINRIPRSLSDVKYWKAAELRHFALYYMIEVLHEEIEEKYLQALMHLVAAMYIFLKDEVRVAEVTLARMLLQDFHESVEDLFGAGNLTYNMHQMLHYADCVLNWGQLFQYSTFPFENANGMLQRLIHGSHRIETEVANSYRIISCMSILDQYSDENQVHFRETKMLGAPISLASLPNEIVEYLQERDLSDSSIYLRAKVAGIKYHSINYTRELKRMNSIAIYDNDSYGTVQVFCIKNNVELCVIKKIKINGPKYRINRRRYQLEHILRYTDTNDFVQFQVRRLKCTAIKLNNNTLCKIVNLVEVNL
jgi:hypothetical protein